MAELAPIAVAAPLEPLAAMLGLVLVGLAIVRKLSR